MKCPDVCRGSMPGRWAAGDPIEGTLWFAKRPSPVLGVVGRNVGGSGSQRGWVRSNVPFSADAAVGSTLHRRLVLIANGPFTLRVCRTAALPITLWQNSTEAV